VASDWPEQPAPLLDVAVRSPTPAASPAVSRPNNLSSPLGGDSFCTPSTRLPVHEQELRVGPCEITNQGDKGFKERGDVYGTPLYTAFVT